MHLLREAFEKGHKIEFNVLEKEINVATLKPYLNTENNRKHVIDFMKKAVECEQRSVIQHLLQCLYSLWMEPEMKSVLECHPKDTIAFRQHIFAWFFEMEQAMIEWIEQDNLFPSQRLIQCFDAIIGRWKWELDNNFLSSTYMPEKEQAALNQKMIEFRQRVWRYSTVDAMNENMVRFLYEEVREHGYVEELDSINCTIFHQLFDKINEDSDQIDQVVSMYRVLERLFGFEKVVSLCCKRDTNNQTAIEILLIKLQNIYKRSNSKYRERK